MKKRIPTIIFILTFLSIQLSYSDPVTITGRIVNGRGGSEKCDNIRIKLKVNSTAKTLTYSDESGVFSFETTGIANGAGAGPDDFSLEQNYPNPFNENTTLSYSVGKPGVAELSIYDISGRKVRSLVHDYRNKGQYISQWNGRNEMNRMCTQGIYFYVLEMNGRKEIRKMTLMNASVFGSAASAFSPVPLAKPSETQTVELIFEDDDIENRTFIYSAPELPATLDLGDIPVHVYPYLMNTPDSLYVLEGQNVNDTLDIYFERPFTLSSEDTDLDWNFTPDSSVVVHYKNVRAQSATLRLQEEGEISRNYFRIYFNLNPRAKIWPYKLRRGFIGQPYAHDIKVENQQGDLSVSLKTGLPSPLTFDGKQIHGTPASASETLLYIDLEDERGVVFHDSALLIISDPAELTFNDCVIDMLESYHRDGRYPYSWVSGYTGVTRDLYYLDNKIATANPDSSHSTYCCGLTFEVYYRSISRLLSDFGDGPDINGISPVQMFSFRSIWFVQNTLGDGPGLALEAYGIGESIEKMSDVKKGDFVQIWRTTGSGHSVIFIDWICDTAGDTTGMRYWSTQTSTNGANYNTEYFSGKGGSIDKEHTYYSRGFKPEDFIDY